MQVYLGPQFMIHYKYSSCLNIVFVTFMFGFGIPILFPIAALSFLTLYVVEKALIYYSYRQPPMLDSVLNDSVLGKLSWAPFLYLIFGYWMLTNPTLLGNDPVPINRIDGKQLTDHFWDSFFEERNLNPGVALPFYAMSIVYFFFLLFKGAIWSLLTTICPCWAVGEISVEEGLENYYAALDDEDRNWLVKEEEYARQTLNFNAL